MSELQVAAVGLGNWGKNVVRSFARAPRARLRAICDASPKLLDAQRALYPDAQALTDYHAVLADDGVDAVTIATPAPTHHALAKAALEAGKHVFVEKPMTLAVADAEDLVATAERMGRTLMVGHLMEYHPAVNWMKQYLASGELGDPLYMYCQRLNLGTVRPDENALWSLAPHDVSIILYLFGMEPDRVAAHGECYLQPGIEDVVFTNLHFPDGRSAQIHVSWLDPHKERRMVLVGSQTMVEFDDMSPMEPIRIYNKGAVKHTGEGMAQVTVRHGDVHIPYFPTSEPLATEAKHFVDSVLDGTTPRSDGRDGLRVVRVLEAASASLRANGQPIEVSYDQSAILRS